jgi:predicted negative regulator of RcsB-dependent stress response
MATQLDLQEQEQLDALKAFWKQQGNLVTWTLILVLGAFAAWNGWQYWQRDQASKAGSMFDELEKAVVAGDADKSGRIFNDLKDGYGRTVFAAQGGLLAAKAQFDKGQTDAAKTTLDWVAQTAGHDELRTVAQLRLAAVHAQSKQFDLAIKALDAAVAPGFEGLVADRRGDVLHLQGKSAEAVVQYQAAFKALGEKLDYRRLVEAKLTALGAAPVAKPTVAVASTSAAPAVPTAPTAPTAPAETAAPAAPVAATAATPAPVGATK